MNAEYLKTRKFDENYCKECWLRKEPSAANVPPPDKDNVNCPAGRVHAPKSFDATINVIKNGGEVCSYNPVRKALGRGALFIEAKK